MAPHSLNVFRDNEGKGTAKEKITYAIRQVEIQRKELEQLRFRLEDRRRAIFDGAVRAFEQSDDMRARLLSGEHIELQKVTHIVNASELALLHIIVRLETLRDVGDVMYVLTNAFREVKKLGKSIAKVAPDLEQAANEINTSLSDVLAELGVLSPQITISLTDSPEEIFQKARTLIEEKTLAVGESSKSLEGVNSNDTLFEKTKRIALLATSEEDGAAIDEEQFKPLLLSKNSDVTEAVRGIVANQGESDAKHFDVVAASQKLNLSADKVEQAYLKVLSGSYKAQQEKKEAK